jgi:hypothetical protein
MPLPPAEPLNSGDPVHDPGNPVLRNKFNHAATSVNDAQRRIAELRSEFDALVIPPWPIASVPALLGAWSAAYGAYLWNEVEWTGSAWALRSPGVSGRAVPLNGEQDLSGLYVRVFQVPVDGGSVTWAFQEPSGFVNVLVKHSSGTAGEYGTDCSLKYDIYTLAQVLLATGLTPGTMPGDASGDSVSRYSEIEYVVPDDYSPGMAYLYQGAWHLYAAAGEIPKTDKIVVPNDLQFDGTDALQAEWTTIVVLEKSEPGTDSPTNDGEWETWATTTDCATPP